MPFLGWLTELQRPALIVAGLLVGLVILLELQEGGEGQENEGSVRT